MAIWSREHTNMRPFSAWSSDNWSRFGSNSKCLITTNMYNRLVSDWTNVVSDYEKWVYFIFIIKGLWALLGSRLWLSMYGHVASVNDFNIVTRAIDVLNDVIILIWFDTFIGIRDRHFIIIGQYIGVWWIWQRRIVSATVDTYATTESTDQSQNGNDKNFSNQPILIWRWSSYCHRLHGSCSERMQNRHHGDRNQFSHTKLVDFIQVQSLNRTIDF